jgi:hypothetical protein
MCPVWIPERATLDDDEHYVDAADGEVRIMGSRGDLLITLAAASGVKSATVFAVLFGTGGGSGTGIQHSPGRAQPRGIGAVGRTPLRRRDTHSQIIVQRSSAPFEVEYFRIAK